MTNEEATEHKVFTFILKVMLPKLHEKGIHLRLDHENNMVEIPGDTASSNGYFQPPDEEEIGEVVCGVGDKSIKDWFGVLLHEYSHFEQWASGCDIWTRYTELADGLSEDENYRQNTAFMRAAAEIEYDCEQRTLVKISEFPEIFDAKEYAQQANAYVACYKPQIKYGSFYAPGRAPYEIQDVWGAMPTKMLEFSKYFDEYAFDHIEWDRCF